MTDLRSVEQIIPSSPIEDTSLTLTTGKHHQRRRFGRTLGGAGVVLLGGFMALKFDLVQFEPSLIIARIMGVNRWWLVFFFALLPLLSLVRAWRWQAVLELYGIKVPLVWSWRVYAIGIAAGAFTPGHAGDLLKIYYLKKRGALMFPAFLSSIIDRLFDVGIALVLAIASLYIFRQPLQEQFSGSLAKDFLFALLLLSGTVVTLLTVFYPPLRLFFLQKILITLLPGAIRGPIMDTLVKMSYRGFLRIFLRSLLGFFFSWFRSWCLFQAFGLYIGPIDLATSFSLLALSYAIPLAPAGIGPRDFILIVVFSQLYPAMPKEEYAAFAEGISAFILLDTVWSFVFGLVMGLWEKRRMDQS